MDNITTTRALEIAQSMPEEFWCTEEFWNIDTDGNSQCCFSGMLNKMYSDDPDELEEAGREKPEVDDFNGYVEVFFNEIHKIPDVTIPSVNDGDVFLYQQPTPKLRCEALFKDMIAAGY